MGRLVLVVQMGMDRRRNKKQIEKDLKKIPGVVDVLCEKTGEVTIGGITDAATLKARLEARLGKPVTVLVDLPTAPSPPVDGSYHPYGYGAMQPPSTVASSHLRAPPLGGYYGPYVGYSQPHYATPPPGARYYYDHDMLIDAPADTFKDEYHHGCSCSIQ